MKKPTKVPPVVVAPATQQPRELAPVGAPRKFRKEDYFELKDVFTERGKADAAVQQTIELAKASVDLAQQVRQHAVNRMKKVMARHGLPDGIYAHDDDAFRLQRME